MWYQSELNSDSDKEVKTFALLDTCSQGAFVTEDLISKLGVSGVKTSINIKTLNGNSYSGRVSDVLGKTEKHIKQLLSK